MNNRYAFFLLAAVALLTGNHALALTISGTVKDSKGEYLPMVYVTILQQSDKTIVQTGQTDEQGRFEYKDIASGKYTVDIQALGFKNKKLELELNADTVLKDIVLEWTDNRMEEVIVKGHKKMVQTELGKTSINVNEQLAQGKSLLDLLKTMPGVTVDGNYNISVNGKDGLMVLINDKRTYLEGRELAEYLRGIDAGNVAKLELMTQPHAKYDAEGNTGIINIKLNKVHSNGWSGNVSSRYNQAMYPFAAANSNLTYAKDKVAVNITPGYYRGVGSLQNNQERTSHINNQPVASVSEDIFRKEVFSDIALGTGIDYDISSKTKTGASARAVYHPNRQVDWSSTIITDHPTATTGYNNTVNEMGFLRKNLRANAYLTQQIDSNNELQVNADYFKTNRLLHQDIRSIDYDANGIPQPNPLLLKNEIPDYTNLYTAQVDYIGKIKNVKTEAGVKASYATIDEQNNFNTFNGSSWVYDSLRSNHFMYHENINSAYVSASGKAGKFETQAGLRIEHTHAEGNQVTQDKQFTIDYTSVIPTAVVNYKADSNNTIEASYAKRMHRPYYRELNPFTWYVSQYNYETGNPLLGPQYTNNIELKHNYKGKLIFTASCSIVNGVYTDELFFDPSTKISRYIVTNNGKKRVSAIGAFFSHELADWFEFSTMANTHYAEFWGRFNGKDVFATGTGYYLSLDTQFRLAHGWMASAHTRYASRYRVGILKSVGGSVSMEAQVSKSFFKDTLNVNVGINDPFNLYRYVELYDFENTTGRQVGNYNQKGASVSLSYNFGKREEGQRRRRTEENSRI